VITVFSGNQTMGAMRGGWGSAPTLTVADALAIGQLPNVAAVSRKSVTAPKSSPTA